MSRSLARTIAKKGERERLSQQRAEPTVPTDPPEGQRRTQEKGAPNPHVHLARGSLK